MLQAAVESIRKKYKSIQHRLDERSRRLWCATEAEAIGWGGIEAVSRATKVARNTIKVGINEILRQRRYPRAKISDRIRKEGGGRKALSETNPRILHDIISLVRPSTRGHPMRTLRWTSKSTRTIAKVLSRKYSSISDRTVAKILKELGYSLQAAKKTKEGKQHPDRDDQFEFIDRKVSDFIRRQQPAISIDTKKKELVGNFKNNGREWRPIRTPRKVNTHDFPSSSVGKAIPYGVYDIAQNEGWVSVGTSHDTSEFAVESIYRWWVEMGKGRYPRARSLMITADAGGSNGVRSKLWKICLQRLSNALGLILHVSHFPPGTSKWNKIEHRLFCYLTNNWKGKPLTCYRTIVSLIAGTRTTTGLKVKAAIDTNEYETGVKISDEELDALNIRVEDFHGDWNYIVMPKRI